MMAYVARSLHPAIPRRILATYARPFSSALPRRSDQPGGTAELEVGQLEGAKFKIEPLRRTGEDPETMRARLVYQSRKRGILESDLLLSTFAQAYLPAMTPVQLQQYDLFLDENDWDIYYWATQLETAASSNPNPSSNSAAAESAASTTSPDNTLDEVKRDPPKGEWAQTVGNFKPAYRPVPRRWKDSEILALLRDHVKSRSVNGGEGGGMAFMPALDQRQ